MRSAQSASTIRVTNLTLLAVIPVGAIIALGIGGCPTLPTDSSNAGVSMKLIASGFTSPVALVAPDDGTSRLFVADLIGLLRVIDGKGDLLPDPLLDVRDEMIDISPNYDERGLLGIALHPDFADNGRFFVYMSVPKGPDTPSDFDSDTVLLEYTIDENEADIADPTSRREILRIGQPQFNHNGGQLAFGADGYLYLGVGDGGNANDEGVGHTPDIGNGQDKTTLRGKLLRIDVDGKEPYDIPADNPFVDDPNARGEIFALGLRNPWRFSFDRNGANERLFVADVGQNQFEELDIVENGDNLGWPIREASACFSMAAPDNSPASCAEKDADGATLVGPVLEYGHDTGISITGGFVYRGIGVPSLAKKYVFGDFSGSFSTPSGRLFTATETSGVWTMEPLALTTAPDGKLERFVLSFGVDADGEIYVLTTANVGPNGETGQVHQLVTAE
ncbi:MAG: PQQ-dependent sugar dehydrogenase [Phycisphaerales bacterium]|nr:PQQ-dependent sugar dehydrogenase [Phycisphaerales bacterium]